MEQKNIIKNSVKKFFGELVEEEKEECGKDLALLNSRKNYPKTVRKDDNSV